MDSVDHPLARVGRWRYPIIAIVSLASAVVAGGRGDWNEFVSAGRLMLGSAGLHVYELRHDVQTGPLSLLLARVFALTPRNGFVLCTIVSAGLGLVAIRLLERTARPSQPSTDFDVLVLTGGCVAAFTWAKLGGYGHLDDALTLTCGVIALHQVKAGRSVWAGVAIGVAIASKPWGVIFLPLTLASRPRDWRSPVAAAAVAAVAWLPFIIGAPGSLRGLRPTVHIAPDSVLDLVGLTDQSLPDWMRIAQLAACLAIGAILVLRNRPESVIAAAVAVRMATDPATWSYYTPGLVIGVLIWDLLDRRRFPWATFAVVVGLAPTWLVPSDTLRAVLRASVAVAVVCAALRRPSLAVVPTPRGPA